MDRMPDEDRHEEYPIGSAREFGLAQILDVPMLHVVEEGKRGTWDRVVARDARWQRDKGV